MAVCCCGADTIDDVHGDATHEGVDGVHGSEGSKIEGGFDGCWIALSRSASQRHILIKGLSLESTGGDEPSDADFGMWWEGARVWGCGCRCTGVGL